MKDADTLSVDSALAGYIAQAGMTTVPEEVLLRARCHLLDTLAAILSGRSLPAGAFGYRFVETASSGAEATLLGGPMRAGLEQAAFANAMAAHADETDDSHAGGRFHPGCAIVPAALAVAEREDSSAPELLKSIALGYDVGARATMALGYSNPRTTVFSTHSIGALFGAAAASGALFRLSPGEAEALLSLTVQQASGLAYWIRDPDHVEKSFDFGAKAARNGVFAALLAKAGMTTPDAPLTGDRSYLEAFAEVPRPELLTQGLGDRFEILQASIKKWSVGSPIQSVLDAIEALFGGACIRGDAIRSVEVRLPANRIHVIDDRPMPAVCCQHLVALALTDGRVSFAGSHDSGRMEDPQIRALRRKVRLIPDEALSRARPERQAVVTVEMADGTRRQHHTRVVRGTPDDPMTSDDVATKARDILRPIMGPRADLLIALCLDGDFTPANLAAACRIDPA
ncbi:MAG: MmgE/PrpD family protein [Rhodobacteraceae bacterium]|nr:MmgE/PrpD family protein [Paracoccaceae bacterium]